ncbi:uncharacterized protein XB5835757.S isoform X2 [Xenopus laevis]|nr:uncharacterized protein XB5835757.S isoform X2 [Xenopus laevis]
MKTVSEVADEKNSAGEAYGEESVIVISDDEGDVTLGLGNSVLLIEDAGEESFVRDKKTEEVLDEELAITFSKRGNVMPHARYDCMTYPFSRAEQETQVPLEDNEKACAECYCYLCDKLASECPNWTSLSSCHCNAHNKSKYWKEQRDSALAGVLTIFNLDLTEIDSELREGGILLQNFINEISIIYKKYLDGEMTNRESLYSCSCTCHRRRTTQLCNKCTTNHTEILVYNYAPVYVTVTEYLNKAVTQSPKMSAVMHLGAVKELVTHKAAPSPVGLKVQHACSKESSVQLMDRIVRTLQRLLVDADFPKDLHDKFVMFFQSLALPPHLYAYVNSLNVLRWDNLFLTSVLAGQNTTGQRTNKGKKEFLWEPLSVVQARVKKLEDDQSYRQLVRYLNAVRCPDAGSLTCLRQKICFYMCKYGDFASAIYALINLKCLPRSMALSLTPAQFDLYLTMFRTSSSPPGNEPVAQEIWIPFAGPPMRKGILVRCAIRILFMNRGLAQQVKSWTALIRTWCTRDMLTPEGKLSPLHLDEPDLQFQGMVTNMSCAILDELCRQTHAYLPAPFPEFPLSCELILVVQAVIQFMMNSVAPLQTTLQLVLAFRTNIWALVLLLDGISPMQSLLFSFVANLNKDLCEDKQLLLAALRRYGSTYASHLVSAFLLHSFDALHSVGFHILDIIILNLKMFTWSPTLAGYLKARVLDLQGLHVLTEIQALQNKIVRLRNRC